MKTKKNKMKNVRIPRPKCVEVDKIKELLDNKYLRLSTTEYVDIIINAHIGMYVYCEFYPQRGEVIRIIRDRYGLPVCFEVKFQEYSDDCTIAYCGNDFIPIDHITFFEHRYQRIESPDVILSILYGDSSMVEDWEDDYPDDSDDTDTKHVENREEK